MAFSNTYLVKIGGSFDGEHNIWMYASADAIATVNSAGYFPAGYGLKEDDMMLVMDTTNHLLDLVRVKSDLDVTDGLRITDTDSD